MPKPDVGPAAYDLLIRLTHMLGGLPPLRVWNASGPPAELQEILRDVYHFLGMDGVELVEAVDVEGDELYHKAAQLVRRCSVESPTGRLRLPVLETPGEARRIVLMDGRLLDAFIPVHVAHVNAELP